MVTNRRLILTLFPFLRRKRCNKHDTCDGERYGTFAYFRHVSDNNCNNDYGKPNCSWWGSSGYGNRGRRKYRCRIDATTS